MGFNSGFKGLTVLEPQRYFSCEFLQCSDGWCVLGREQEIRTEQVLKDQLQPRAQGCCFQETGSFMSWCIVAE